MQVENNEEYETLYNQGFDDKNTDVEAVEEDKEEEEQEEELEQPEEAEVEEKESEEETQEEEDTTTDEEEESNELEMFEVKHNGQTMKLTKDEMVTMASKGFDYTSKTQDLASKRRTLDVIDGLDDDLLKTVKDAKEGNKEAVAKLVKDFGIDPYDIDTDTGYQPVIKEKNYALDDVIDRINQDTTNAEVLNGWVKTMPKKSQDFLASNPNILDELYSHTVNGVSQKVMPEVMKQMALNPNLDFMNTYNQIHGVMIQPKEEVREEAKKVKPTASKEQKKKASISKSTSNSKINDHKDIWEDDDLYKKMQEMRRR